MAAFLRRRWILLSCVVVLVACSTADLASIAYGGNAEYRISGVLEGAFLFMDSRSVSLDPEEFSFVRANLHHPSFGGYPEGFFGQGGKYFFQIPLWLPLSAILGWLVIRELRWREKMARAREAAM